MPPSIAIFPLFKCCLVETAARAAPLSFWNWNPLSPAPIITLDKL